MCVGKSRAGLDAISVYLEGYFTPAQFRVAHDFRLRSFFFGPVGTHVAGKSMSKKKEIGRRKGKDGLLFLTFLSKFEAEVVIRFGFI